MDPHQWPARSRGRDRGQVVLLALAAVVLTAMLAVGLAHMAAGVVRREQAQAAADAAALAGARRPAGGRHGWRRRTGRPWWPCRVQPASGTIEVTVTVAYRGALARARAARAP